MPDRLERRRSRVVDTGVGFRNNSRMQNLFLVLSFLILPAPALAAGTMVPDMGQAMLLNLLLGFCAVFLVWFVLRLTPSWRNRVGANPKLRKLGVFNTVAVLITIAVTVICLAVQSYMLLIVGFGGIPILGVAMLIEIVWGWSLSKSYV